MGGRTAAGESARMADKEVKIQFNTAANTAGAKKAEESIASLETEVKRLKEELRTATIGSKEFEDLSTKIGETERRLSDAGNESAKFAQKAGAVRESTRNMGGAVLEASRAFEDMQYGVRGVLNNIPGLVATLGGSAGLAGVISLVAVGLSILGPKMFSLGEDAEKPKDKINGLRDILKSLDTALGKIKETETDMAGGGVKAFEDRKTAIDLATAAARANIEALKSQIEHEGKLLKIQREGELASVDSRQRKGELTTDEAELQRTSIKTQMQKDELERLKSLADTDAKVFQVQLDAAKKKQEAAAAEAEAATQALEARKEQIQQLKREVLIRQQLETQIQTLSEQAKKIPNSDKLPFLQDSEIERLRQLAAQPIVDQGPANRDRNNSIEAARATLAHLERFNELLEKRAELEREIAEKAPRPIQDVKVKDENGEDRTIPSAAKREKDRLEEGVKGELPSLAELNENVKTFGEAAKSAAERVKEAEQALAQKESSNFQQDTQRREVAAADNPVLREVEKNAAEGARALLSQIMAALGTQAQSEEVQKKAQEVSAALADGLQANEADPVANALRALIGKIQADNSARATLSQQIGSFMEAAVQKISQLSERVKELRTDLNKVDGQMGNPNH